MREAIAGFYGSNFRNDLLILLLCYVPISLLIGLGLRPALSGLNHLFDKKLAETEFMMCEPHEAELSRSTQLSMLLQASLSIEDLRLVTAERAQKFENNYRKMVRIGFLAIAIIPLIFLIQSRIKDRVPDFVDYLYYRNLCMADCYRIYPYKTGGTKRNGRYVL